MPKVTQAEKWVFDRTADDKSFAQSPGTWELLQMNVKFLPRTKTWSMEGEDRVVGFSGSEDSF